MVKPMSRMHGRLPGRTVQDIFEPYRILQEEADEVGIAGEQRPDSLQDVRLRVAAA
jgi:hypothetical protein